MDPAMHHRSLSALAIPLYLEAGAAPQRLTDDQRQWLINADGKASELARHFKSGDGPIAPGDPRALLADSPSMAVAEHHGVIGVMTMRPLGVSLAQYGEAYSRDAKPIRAAEFMHFVRQVANEVVFIEDAWPYSEVYLAAHAGNRDRELCLCAFTPLTGAESLLFSSPYDSPSRLRGGGGNGISELDAFIFCDVAAMQIPYANNQMMCDQDLLPHHPEP